MFGSLNYFTYIRTVLIIKNSKMSKVIFTLAVWFILFPLNNFLKKVTK